MNTFYKSLEQSVRLNVWLVSSPALIFLFYNQELFSHRFLHRVGPRSCDLQTAVNAGSLPIHSCV